MSRSATPAAILLAAAGSASAAPETACSVDPRGDTDEPFHHGIGFLVENDMAGGE